MRIVIVACALGLGVLAGASLLGVAEGETSTAGGPSPAPTRTVSVQGVASVPIVQNADLLAANAVYRQAMGSAVSDGQSKAQFLASQTAATLGAVQSVAEDGGYIDCVQGEYEGQQPDFGSGSIATPAAGFAGALAPRSSTPALAKGKPRHKHHRRATAKKALAGGCTLSTEVNLIYQLS
jgi:hypothetical protein